MPSFARDLLIAFGKSHAVRFLIALALVAGCTSKEPAKNNANGKVGGPVPVVTSPAIQKTVPVQIRAIGNMEPYSAVAIKTRVDGQIVRTHFSEGKDVLAGDLLFDLDPRDYEARLKQAEATLAQDQAQLEYSRAQEDRYQALFKEELVSRETYQQMKMNLESATAKIRVDQAAIESARLLLEYCQIRSPIGGRTGKILIQMGNMVKAIDDNPLVIINQISPIYVAFSVSEKHLDAIRKYKTLGTLKVQASVQQNGEVSALGKLEFIDNTVDNTTGMIKLKAAFPNKGKRFWPGQFANVALDLYEQKDAITIPSQALQVGPNGQYTFVVKPDLTVETRPVIVDRMNAEEAVIAKGLTAGETVVTLGQLRLSPGAKVLPKPARETP
ncbi:MAG: efflux RND transporter periplasmic adaptor subunit [Nitrospinae bacterium]|nr:efflux RND transporter periplasmic adaptor subunit [Nitrospinota bacterium]